MKRCRQYQQFLAYRPADISAQMQLGIAFVGAGPSGRCDRPVPSGRRAQSRGRGSPPQSGPGASSKGRVRGGDSLRPAGRGPAPRRRRGPRRARNRAGRAWAGLTRESPKYGVPCSLIRTTMRCATPQAALEAKAAAGRRPERDIIPYEAYYPGRRRHPAVPRDGDRRRRRSRARPTLQPSRFCSPSCSATSRFSVSRTRPRTSSATRVHDTRTAILEASVGALQRSDESRSRFATVEVRVGDYTLDNTHPIRGDTGRPARASARSRCR